MIVENIPVAQLIPYAKNARTHDDAQVAQIAASIREFGWTNPILIDGDKGLIAGHGRLMAARKLGMDTVPCIELSGMTDTQKRAYIIADNAIALSSEWDADLLSLELNDLHLEEFDMALIGFDANELSAAMGLDSLPPAPGSSTKEIDPDEYVMGCMCPKCGFEFDPK